MRLELPPELTLQESEKQGEFKISYYAPAEKLADLNDLCQQQLNALAAPYCTISSVDPFTNDGLIDFLPVGVDKAYAGRWLAGRIGIDYEKSVIYAGDSGNDLAALTSGCRAILVGNAADSLREKIQKLPNGDRVYFASQTSSSAVLEGVRHFL